jgi:hypothetical protein
MVADEVDEGVETDEDVDDDIEMDDTDERVAAAAASAAAAVEDEVIEDEWWWLWLWLWWWCLVLLLPTPLPLLLLPLLLLLLLPKGLVTRPPCVTRCAGFRERVGDMGMPARDAAGAAEVAMASNSAAPCAVGADPPFPNSPPAPLALFLMAAAPPKLLKPEASPLPYKLSCIIARGVVVELELLL